MLFHAEYVYLPAPYAKIVVKPPMYAKTSIHMQKSAMNTAIFDFKILADIFAEIYSQFVMCNVKTLHNDRYW